MDQKLIGLLVNRIIPWITGPDVLEMGSGDDQWTEQIIAHFGHSHLVDGAQTLIDCAREKYGEKLVTYHSLFEDLKPPKKFDTIIASLVLEHVEDPVRVLATASEWLKPLGHIIVNVPNAGSLHRRLAVCMGLQRTPGELGPSDLSLGHRRVYSVSEMESDIVKAGLRIMRKQGIFIKLLPQGMMTDFSDSMLEGLVKLGDELAMEYACIISFDCGKKGA